VIREKESMEKHRMEDVTQRAFEKKRTNVRDPRRYLCSGFNSKNEKQGSRSAARNDGTTRAERKETLSKF